MRLKNLPAIESYPGAGRESCDRLEFKVAAATISESFGHLETRLKVGEVPRHDRSREVRMTIIYPRDRYLLGGVSFSDEVQMKDIVGYCHIAQRPDSYGRDVPVGTIDYQPAMKVEDPVSGASYPSIFSARIFIGERQFDQIVRTLETGRLPSTVSMTIRGLLRPDEFSLKWNSLENPELPVIAFEASFVVATDNTINRENGSFRHISEPSYYPINRDDFGKLAQTSQHLEDLHKSVRSIGWCVALLVVFGVFSFF